MDVIGKTKKVTLVKPAIQFYDTDECAEALLIFGLDPVRVKYPEKKLIIRTPQGEIAAAEGDYVAKDADGKLHIISQEVFEGALDDYGAQEGR